MGLSDDTTPMRNPEDHINIGAYWGKGQKLAFPRKGTGNLCASLMNRLSQMDPSHIRISCLPATCLNV